MMHLFRLLVFVFISHAAASNCPDWDTDKGNFHQTCVMPQSFYYIPGMGINVTCLRNDGKTNVSSTLGLSKCLGYDVKENKLVWKIPPACNATTEDERAVHNTDNKLSVMSRFESRKTKVVSGT